MASVSALRDVIARLSDSDRAFAQSLLDQTRLSVKQASWVDRLIARAITPRNSPALMVPELVEFMYEAGLKRPVLLLLAGDKPIRLAVAGPGSRTPGFLIVTSPHKTFADRLFYGRIGPDGRFEASLKPEPETQTAVEAALKAMATDPAGTAAKYGKMTGSCCFCSITLSDPRSVHVGYGKICARKYNLPWTKE